MRPCEIIFVKDDRGWKWRQVDERRMPVGELSPETYPLFYDCLQAARSRGYQPGVKYL
jgi:hypothetical protein